MQSLEISLSHLAKYLKLLAENERKLDLSRQVLCEQENFEPYLIFKLFDLENKGFITGIDIFRFMKYFLEKN